MTNFEDFVKDLKIIHPEKGLIPFDMYSYQKRLVKMCDEECVMRNVL